MQKLNDIAEAVGFLKQQCVLKDGGKSMFVMKDGRVFCYSSGTRYSMSLEDFVQLYKNTGLYLYREESGIDEEKDEAYYRYYRK